MPADKPKSFNDEDPPPPPSTIRAADALAETTTAPPKVVAPTSDPLKPAPPEISRYRILDLIGVGGMGSVWHAEQREPVRRSVAIKVIKAGVDTAEVIARFESERQALALMDHPNIARILDAGQDDRGHPYFVMEYVPGIALTKYADDSKLTVRQRLDLFLQVCEAISHAHSKAIIHRDIKSSNVLAYHTGETATVKVIDFGIAKALTGGRLTDRTYFTQRGQAIGTYENMSPEQADASPDIDTRTDVYALGVLLYELLTGSAPFTQQMLTRAGDGEIRRIIREVAPEKPSTRLASLGKAGSTVAVARQSQLPALTRELRSELEWIPLKALRKERNRRYASVLQFAEDVRNYIDGRPLMAGPDSRRYVLGKFIRRNKAAIAGCAALLLVLILGAVGTSIGFVRAKAALAREADQRRRAEARFADVRQLAHDFMFQIDPALVNVTGATPARKLLAELSLRSLDQLSRDEASDKALRQDLAVNYDMVGDILGQPAAANVGDSTGALASYKKSFEIRQKLAAENPSDSNAQRDLVISYEKLAELQAITGDRKTALAGMQQAVTISQQLLKQNPTDRQAQRDILVASQRMGDLLTASGRREEALQNYEAALVTGSKLAATSPTSAGAKRDLSLCYQNLGEVQSVMGRRDEAMVNYQKDLQIRLGLAENDPSSFEAKRDLSVCYQRMGDLLFANSQTGDALASLQKSLEITIELQRADPKNLELARDLSVGYSKLGSVQATAGMTQDAVANFQRAKQIQLKLAGIDPSNVQTPHDLMASCLNLGQLQASAGNFDGAMRNYQEAMDHINELLQLDPGNWIAKRDQFVTLTNLGDLQRSTHALPAALKTDREALELATRLAKEHPSSQAQRDLALAYEISANALEDNHQPAEAMESYAQQLKISREIVSDDPGSIPLRVALANGLRQMGDLLAAGKNWPDAKASYQESLDLFVQLSQADPSNSKTMRGLAVGYGRIADVQIAAGQTDPAIANYRKDLEISEQRLARDPSDPEAPRDVAVIHYKIATVFEQAAGQTGISKAVRKTNVESAIVELNKSRDLFVNLATAKKLARSDANNPELIGKEIQKCRDSLVEDGLPTSQPK